MPFLNHPLPLWLPLLFAFLAAPALAIGCSFSGCSINSVMRRMRRAGIGRG